MQLMINGTLVKLAAEKIISFCLSTTLNSKIGTQST